MENEACQKAGFFSRLFQRLKDRPADPPDIQDGINYRRGRRFFNVDYAMNATITNLTGSTYVAALITYLGGSDSLIGILGSLTMLLTPLQMAAAYLFDRMMRRKVFCVVLNGLSKLLLGFMFLVPLLFGKPDQGGLEWMVVSFAVSQIFYNIQGPGATNWLVDLVPESIRSRYFANRESLSLILGAIFMLVSGKLVDDLQAVFGQVQAFTFIGVTVLVLAVVDAIFLALCDEPKTKQSAMKEQAKTKPEAASAAGEKSKSTFSLLLQPFRYKSFLIILALSVFWNVSSCFGSPFSATYQVNDLQMSFSYIMTLSVISMVIRIFLAPVAGRIAGRIGYTPVLAVSIVLIAAHYVLWAFTVPSNMSVMLPTLFVVSALGFAGQNICLFNMQVSSMPEAIRTTCVSLMNTISGVAGFLSTLVASAILEHLDMQEFSLLGIPFSGLQVLFLVTSVLMFACGFFAFLLIKHTGLKAE